MNFSRVATSSFPMTASSSLTNPIPIQKQELKRSTSIENMYDEEDIQLDSIKPGSSPQYSESSNIPNHPMNPAGSPPKIDIRTIRDIYLNCMAKIQLEESKLIK
jgi:hypothetical protein